MFSLYEMLNNNQWYDFYDLDYYYGRAGNYRIDNPATGTLWADLDAGQVYGKDDGKCDICVPAESGREGPSKEIRVRRD